MKKVIIISGATSGLGLEIAKNLSKENTVYILSNSHVHDICKEINCKGYTVDITDFAKIDQIVNKIYSAENRIDVVINNAGIWVQGELDTNTYEQIHQTFSVNTIGTVYLTRAVVPFLKKNKEGTIINVISQAGLNAKTERSVYHASKWAITGFTKCLAIELSSYNIKVTGLYPGLLNTKLFERAGYNRDLSTSLDINNIVAGIDYIIKAPKEVLITDLGIRHISNI